MIADHPLSTAIIAARISSSSTAVRCSVAATDEWPVYVAFAAPPGADVNPTMF